MPTVKKILSTSSLEETIQQNLATLNEADETADDYTDIVKTIVCAFYKGHQNCVGCKKPTDTLMSCKDDYQDKILSRPMLKWDKSFDKVEIRTKKNIALIKDEGYVLTCDKCYLSDTCPEYKKLSTCSIEWAPEIDVKDNKQLIDYLIQLQTERISFARQAEMQDGGVPDQNLSGEIDRLTSMTQSKANLLADKFSLKIEASSQGNSGGGILSKLFGNMNNTALPENKTENIDAVVTDVKELPIATEKILPINDAKTNDTKVTRPRSKSKT